MTNSSGGKTEPTFSSDQEVQLDLLQRRLNNKTRRALRVIQFNIIALTAGASISQLSGGLVIEFNQLITMGGILVILSTAISMVGLTLNGTALSWANCNADGLHGSSLLFEYRKRNQYLTWISPLGIITGAAGTALVLVGIAESAGLELNNKWWVILSGVCVFLIGGSLLGAYLAQSISQQATTVLSGDDGER